MYDSWLYVRDVNTIIKFVVLMAKNTLALILS